MRAAASLFATRVSGRQGYQIAMIFSINRSLAFLLAIATIFIREPVRILQILQNSIITEGDPVRVMGGRLERTSLQLCPNKRQREIGEWRKQLFLGLCCLRVD